MRKTREERWELKGLDLRANRQDKESEAIRQLFGARFEISVSASMIA